jgi:hypothetical protein
MVDTDYEGINLVLSGFGLGIRTMNLGDEKLQKSP